MILLGRRERTALNCVIWALRRCSENAVVSQVVVVRERLEDVGFVCQSDSKGQWGLIDVRKEAETGCGCWMVDMWPHQWLSGQDKG